VAFGGPPLDVDLIEVRGIGGRRAFARWARDGFAVGDLVLVCDNAPAPASVVDQVPEAWRADLRLVSLAARISAPPRIVAKAAFDPVHVHAEDLAATSRSGSFRLGAAKSVVTRVRVGDDLGGGRSLIGDRATGWVIEVPPSAPGAGKLRKGAFVWAILADPRFQPLPGGEAEPGKPRLWLTLRDAEDAYLR
jgi:hypothetical protein